MEGAAILVPAGLAFGHGGLALFAHFDLFRQAAVSLTKDTRYALGSHPRQDALHELLGDGQHGEQASFLDGGIPFGQGRGQADDGWINRRAGQGSQNGSAPQLVQQHDGNVSHGVSL